MSSETVMALLDPRCDCQLGGGEESVRVGPGICPQQLLRPAQWTDFRFGLGTAPVQNSWQAFGLDGWRSADKALALIPHVHATEIATLMQDSFSPHHGIAIVRTIGVHHAYDLIVRSHEAPLIRTHGSPAHA
jgi:hypothetical protein